MDIGSECAQNVAWHTEKVGDQVDNMVIWMRDVHVGMDEIDWAFRYAYPASKFTSYESE